MLDFILNTDTTNAEFIIIAIIIIYLFIYWKTTLIKVE